MNLSLPSFKKTITILSLVLLCINLFIIYQYSLEEKRVVRLFSISCYFMIFWAYKGFRNKHILYVFILLILADIFNLCYEYDIFNKLISAIKISAYLILVKSILKKLKLFKKRKPIWFIFIGVFVSLNLLLLYQVVWETSNKMNDNLQLLLFMIYGIVLIAASMISAYYDFIYHTKRSLYFFYFTFTLVFSDVSWFIAYFLELPFFYYIETILYLISIYFILKYAVETSQSEDILLFED